MIGALAFAFRSRLPRVATVWLVLVAAPLTGSQALAQGGNRAVPRAQYFAALSTYYAGEYDNALRGFRLSATQAVRIGQQRWIDTICHHTMEGECYYQMGQMSQALDQYNAALQLFLVNKEWMVAVEYPSAIGPSNNAGLRRINWGAPQRNTRTGSFPDSMLTSQNPLGRVGVGPRGQVVGVPVLYPIVAQEIVRCTALAIQRRSQIMGPACQHDSLTSQLIAALSARPAPPNHWSQAWISVQLGMAYASAGDTEQAVRELTSSLVIGGQFDHPLTGLALLELGRLALQQQQLDAAAVNFLEASFAAAAFNQPDVMEEAFRYGMITHLAAGQPGLYPPLDAAADWARRQNFDVLRTSLMLLAAENLAVNGHTAEADTRLSEADRSAARTDMPSGAMGARHQFIAALVSYQEGRLAQAETALAAAMNFQRRSSHRLFQIALADNLFTSGAVSPRVAEDLYTETLREPTDADWVYEPMESLSVLLVPHPLPLEHWFEVALDRKKPERALEIADQIRRHRFYSTLPMGGRLLSLRWLLSAPAEVLDEQTLTQRRNILGKFPPLAELVRKESALRVQLAQLPPNADDNATVNRRDDLLGQLTEIGAEQERLLSEIALRREPANLIFPPARTTEQIRNSLTEGQVALIYFSTSRFVHAFMFTRDNYTDWPVVAPSQFDPPMTEMFRLMRMHGPNSQLELGQLADESWKTPAAELLGMLTNNAEPDFWSRYEELIIVPDGRLWYLPFETLQVGAPGGPTSELGSEIRIRYAPTASLIVPDGRGRPRAGETAVVLGALSPRDGTAVADETFQELSSVLPGSIAYRDPVSSPPNVLASTWSRMVVLDDSSDSRRGLYDWSPSQLNSGQAGSNLAGWMQMPFGRPDQVLLPGFHTAAENGLGQEDTGNEVFLTICGLMAGGSRTVLLARWRPGGRTASELIREFAQELPHTSASSAWQRSVKLARASQLQFENEPRVRAPAVVEVPVTADHPFFWAAYMLVDSGARSPADEAGDP